MPNNITSYAFHLCLPRCYAQSQYPTINGIVPLQVGGFAPRSRKWTLELA